MKRRDWLAAAAGLPWLSSCAPAASALPGGFQGMAFERGHLLRDPAQHWPAPAVSRRVGALVLGAGIAGLAAARALRQGGVDDLAVLELEDQAGGNSRGTVLDGQPCPMGAHYLPVPSDDAPQVQALLEELGLRRREAGRWVIDELHLCHSPQERLYFQGRWQDSLLPQRDVGPATLAQYRLFARRVGECQRQARFVVPMAGQTLAPLHLALDTLTFDDWLQREGLSDPQLRWYLDYCCRDDYGCGSSQVSAWAGIHYFACRHGFQAPGDEEADDPGVLTWPEGNGWLAARLAEPLQQGRSGPLFTGRVVLRVEAQRHGVLVDSWDCTAQRVERWLAAHCVLALPVHVVARVLSAPPDWVLGTARRWQHAAWVVANLHLSGPLDDRPGAAPAWDNVLYGQADLGYVDAGHQRLDPRPGPTVLSFYTALGSAGAARQQLLEQPWTHWLEQIQTAYRAPHPDLMRHATRLAVTRHGHAMAVPVPGVLRHLAGLPGAVSGRGGLSLPAVLGERRLGFAHGDWSGYSVFEEAFSRGHMAGWAAVRALRGRSED